MPDMDLNHIAGELDAKLYGDRGMFVPRILTALESVQSETRHATLREAADAVDNGIMRDNPASTIRALIDKPDAPDPMLDKTAAINADSGGE